MTGDLVATLLTNFGAPGALLAFMIWDRLQQNKLSRERIDADLKMATALTLLTAKIDGHVR